LSSLGKTTTKNDPHHYPAKRDTGSKNPTKEYPELKVKKAGAIHCGNLR